MRELLEVLGNLFEFSFFKNEKKRSFFNWSIYKINTLRVTVNALHFEDLCTAEKLFSIESLYVHYDDIANHNNIMITNATCDWEYYTGSGPKLTHQRSICDC